MMVVPEGRKPRVLVMIGEAPSRTSNPAMPLSAAPTRKKLEGLFGREAYARALKFNLLGAWPGKAGKGDRFDLDAARKSSQALRTSFALLRGVEWFVVLLGRRAAEAFAGAHQMTYFAPESLHSHTTIAMIPHPTGINRWWNDPSNARRAVRFCRKVGRETE